jgi:hypothetical protein
MNSNSSIEAVKAGLIVGLISIILVMAVYLTDVNLLVDWKYSISVFVISIVLFVTFGRKYRDHFLAGFISFNEAFKFLFIAAICSTILNGLFTIILYNVIDPELPKVIIERTLQSTEEMMENFTSSSEEMDETMEELERTLPYGFTPAGILSNSWAWILVGAFYALIASIFVKKSKPDFDFE